MDTRASVASKLSLEDYVRLDGLSPEMLDAILNYLLTLRTSETTKELYLQRLRKFSLWLLNQGIKAFADVGKSHIDRFLATYDRNNTRNGYITTLRLFYRGFLKQPEVVRDLKYYREKRAQVVSSGINWVCKDCGRAYRKVKRRERS